MDLYIRDFQLQDIKAVHALNEGAVPNMNSLTELQLMGLIAKSAYAKVAVVNGGVAGFMLALGEGQAYKSLNYRWFSHNCENFVYIDRIVVAEKFRGHGIATKFYRDIEETCADNAQWLACEVNLSPPNPGSLSFHHKFGFYEIGQQDTENGTKRVSLLIKTLRANKAPCVLRDVA